MKQKLSVKKIVLASIGALSALLLLISMSFFYVYNPSLPKNVSLDDTMLKDFMRESGFSMLGFESMFFEYVELEVLEIPTGIASYLMLIGAIGGLALTVFPLFLCNEKKAEKLSTLSVVINVCLSIAYLIVGIVVVVSVNGVIKEDMEIGSINIVQTKALLCSTASFWAVILQALILTAYILCNKLLKAKEEVNETKERAFEIDNIKQENEMIEILTRYKKLCDDGVITHDEYEKKKLQILATK